MEKISFQRRTLSKNIILGAGAVALSGTVYTPHAHAIAPLIRLLIPFFGRNTAKKLIQKEVTKQVARATSKQALKRAGLVTAGGITFAGTASTAAMAYDVYNLSNVFSENTQENIAEYKQQELAGQTDIPLEMIWNIHEENIFDIYVKNISNQVVHEDLVLGIFDVKKQKNIVEYNIGKINLFPQELEVHPGPPLRDFDEYFSSGDIIELRIYPQRMENRYKLQTSRTGAILLES